MQLILLAEYEDAQMPIHSQTSKLALFCKKQFQIWKYLKSSLKKSWHKKII